MRHFGIGVFVLFVFLVVVNSSNASRHDPNYKTLDSLALLLKGFNAAKAKENDIGLDETCIDSKSISPLSTS